jgi:peptidyl-prolyl cis-trans isomerase B (cyclophilin B)
MAARQAAARRRRLLQARIGAGVAGVVVVAAMVWIVVAMTSGGSTPSANTSAAPTACSWITDALPTPTPGASPSLPPGIKDVGTPPTDVPRSGYQVLTFETNLGAIKVEMNLAKTPCTAASLAYLAGKGFYDGTSCHRLVDSIFALQCGDPSGTGSGGATYRFADENLPKGKLPAYHAGDVAMANTGQPGSNGSQFFFLWDNSQLQADYTLWGKVIEGMDIVKKVAAGGDDGAFAQQAGGGHPKVKITFNRVTVGPVSQESQVKPTTAEPTSTPSGTAPAPPSPSS